jgi:hypothetical protein
MTAPASVVIQYPITVLTAPFTMPAVGATSPATVGATEWMVIGSSVAVQGAGVLIVTNVTGSTTAVLENPSPANTGNAVAETVIPVGNSVGVGALTGLSGVPTYVPTVVGSVGMSAVHLTQTFAQKVPFDATVATIPFVMPSGANLGDTVTFVDTSNPTGNPGGCPSGNLPTIVDPLYPIQQQQGQGAIVLVAAGTPVTLPPGGPSTWWLTKNTVTNTTYWAAI